MTTQGYLHGVVEEEQESLAQGSRDPKAAGLDVDKRPRPRMSCMVKSIRSLPSVPRA